MLPSSNAKPEAVKVPDSFAVQQLEFLIQIAELVDTLEKLPKEKYKERETAQYNLNVAGIRGHLIGNFESLYAAEDKPALGPTLRDAVNSIFGEKAVAKVLLNNIDNPDNSIKHRVKFLKFLAHNLVARGNKKQFRRYEGKTDPKLSADATTTMEGLFTPKGVELYKAAVKEEGESAAFRLAVAYKSTQYFKGPKLEQLLYIWVGGASGSGKSFGASGVIKTLLKHMRNLSETDQQGNYFVFVDGGIARQVSQMRKLALKIALRCGFSSISDLNDLFGMLESDPHNVKKTTGKLALESGRVNVIVPETFSDCANPLSRCTDILDAEKTTREKGMVHVFSEVLPAAGQLEEFTNVRVPRISKERANSLKFGVENGATIQFDNLNELELPCESKAPPSVTSIKFGLIGTANARAVWARCGEEAGKSEPSPRIHIVVLNELMYIDYLGVDTSLRISAEDFKNYKKAIGNTAMQQLSVQGWLEQMKQAKALAPATIFIERFDVDTVRREYCALANEAAFVAGLPVPDLGQAQPAAKTGLRQSMAVIPVGDDKREELIRRLAHFSMVLAANTDISKAARDEMFETTGKRICQLLNTGVSKESPTVGAEINVVSVDAGKFGEWLMLLDRAMKRSPPEERDAARNLLIREWQTQIMQSYASQQDKAAAMRELERQAQRFTNVQTPQAPPRKAQLQTTTTTVKPIAPPREPAVKTPVAPPREPVVKQPVAPPRPREQGRTGMPNDESQQRASSAPVLPTVKDPVPSPVAKQVQTKVQKAPAKLSSSHSSVFAHRAPEGAGNKPPPRPKEATEGPPPPTITPPKTKKGV